MTEQKIMEYIDAEIKVLRKELEDLEKKLAKKGK